MGPSGRSESCARMACSGTDESGVYWGVGEQFASHRTVIHSIGEYVRGDAHTNTTEGYFSILKRGIYGVYHHVSQQHLKRYLAEFDFRYNERIALGIDDIAQVGTWRTSNQIIRLRGRCSCELTSVHRKQE
jgi:hypothetical protein